MAVIIRKFLIETKQSNFTVFESDTNNSTSPPGPTPPPPKEELITSYTVFLSPSPVNYTFDNIEDKNTEMTRLEISFAASFVSEKAFKLRLCLKKLTFYFEDETIRIAHNLEWSSRDTHTDKYSNNW